MSSIKQPLLRYCVTAHISFELAHEVMRRFDRECPHEVFDIEPVGTAGARALLLREPDFFFGDLSKAGEGRNVARGSIGRNRQRAAVIHHMRRPRVSLLLVPD